MKEIILEKLNANIRKGQLWIALYGDEHIAALQLTQVDILEYCELSGTFSYPGLVLHDPPDRGWNDCD